MNLSFEGRPEEGQAIRVICEALDAGMQLLDTADVYGLGEHEFGHNEALVAKALKEWGGSRESVVLATKGGVRRPGGDWVHDGSPAYLKSACEASLRALGVDRIDLYQLHAPDEQVPLSESLGALDELRREGKIRWMGLSNVSLAQIEQSLDSFDLVSVQNQASPYYLSGLQDGILALCEQKGLAFLAHSPLGGWQAGRIAHEVLLQELAAESGHSPHQLVLAWLLSRSPALMPIPGASRAGNAISSAAVARIVLDKDVLLRMDDFFSSLQPQRDS
ncbi:MAG: aldo/keto reductase [Deltaproteobacteria bacterium]|nr:aldo/keto reductase [Deltaproteobacteria bacterium]